MGRFLDEAAAWDFQASWSRVQSGRPIECEVRVRLHDGEFRWHLLRSEPGFRAGRPPAVARDGHRRSRPAGDFPRGRSPGHPAGCGTEAAGPGLDEPVDHVDVVRRAIPEAERTPPRDPRHPARGRRRVRRPGAGAFVQHGRPRSIRPGRPDRPVRRMAGPPPALAPGRRHAGPGRRLPGGPGPSGGGERRDGSLGPGPGRPAAAARPAAFPCGTGPAGSAAGSRSCAT